MKKIICFALVFAMLFSGCSRWSVEIVDPTKPVEGESELAGSKADIPETIDEFIRECENTEAEKFMYTEEAKKQIEFFTSNCAHIDFVSSEDADSSVLNWFSQDIYSQVGEGALTENGNKFEFSKELGNHYLFKYFGVEYEPAEDDFYYNAETGNYWLGTAGGGAPNEFISHYFYMSNENYVTVHVIYKNFGGSYGHSSMGMEILESAEGKFLRLLSVEKRDEFSEPTFEDQALELAFQIVESYQGKGLENGSYEFSENDVTRFIQRTVIYTNMNKRFRKNAPYIGIFPRDGEFRYHFSEEGIEKIAFEVFGLENFKVNMDGFHYDREKGEYISAMEWSWNESYTIAYPEVEINGNEYICSFVLKSSTYFEERDESYGEYKITFELINDEFLRYKGFEKITDANEPPVESFSKILVYSDDNHQILHEISAEELENWISIIKPAEWKEDTSEKEGGSLFDPIIIGRKDSGTIYMGFDNYGDEIALIKWGKGSIYSKNYVMPEGTLAKAKAFEEKIIKENPTAYNYPECLYDLSAEAFLNRENDDYILYLDELLCCCDWTAAKEDRTKLYEGFSSAAELNSKILYNVFMFTFDYCGASADTNMAKAAWFNESDQKYHIPYNDIYTVLGKYFEDYSFDMGETGVNYDYDKFDIAILIDGGYGVTSFRGDKREVVSVTKNGDGTLTAVVESHVYHMDDKDNMILSEKPEKRNTMILRPHENGCIVISHKVESIGD